VLSVFPGVGGGGDSGGNGSSSSWLFIGQDFLQSVGFHFQMTRRHLSLLKQVTL
jgi:hypothetical protein